MCSHVAKYISWVSDNQASWTLNAAGVGPDPVVDISARVVPQEPMVGALTLHLIINQAKNIH